MGLHLRNMIKFHLHTGKQLKSVRTAVFVECILKSPPKQCSKKLKELIPVFVFANVSDILIMMNGPKLTYLRI
jgi:hypothetical protein